MMNWQGGSQMFSGFHPMNALLSPFMATQMFPAGRPVFDPATMNRQMFRQQLADWRGPMNAMHGQHTPGVPAPVPASGPTHLPYQLPTYSIGG